MVSFSFCSLFLLLCRSFLVLCSPTYLLSFAFFFCCTHWHEEITRPGIKPMLHQWPELQCQILNLLHNQGTPSFAFVVCAFGVRSKKFLLRPVSRGFFYMFSSQSFMISVLLFKSVIHFKLISVSGVRQGSSFIHLHEQNSFLSIIFLKRLSFSNWLSYRHHIVSS